MKFDSVGKVERMEWGEPELGQVYTHSGTEVWSSVHWVPPPPRMAALAQPDNSGLSTA